MVQPFELIRTPRLDLHCLSFDELREKTLNDRAFANPHGVYTGEDLPRANRVADVAEHPEHRRWYYRIIVDRTRGIAVGSVSFHGPPDERGMIEIGIGIAAEERGNGFAQEAIDGMWRWAVNEPSVRFLRYTVSPSNAPSIAIISRFGFPQIGEQIDEEDGLELIFEIPATAYSPR